MANWIADRIEVRGGKIFANGDEIDGYQALRVLGRGANGLVFLVLNEDLNRQEALKVWTKSRQSDSRDKIAQGLQEVRKSISASRDYTAEIYSSGRVGGLLYCTIEYIRGGITLKDFYNREREYGFVNFEARYEFARFYVHALTITARRGALHGDPHWQNVMVIDPYLSLSRRHALGPNKGHRLLDFGTSVFSNKGSSEKRHWNIFHHELKRLLLPFNRNNEIVPYLMAQNSEMEESVDIDDYYHFLVRTFEVENIYQI